MILCKGIRDLTGWDTGTELEGGEGAVLVQFSGEGFLE